MRAFHIALLLTTGCNSVFYQPDRNRYLTPDRLGTPWEDFTIDGADGKRLAATHFKPAGNAAPKGMVVHFHGNAQNMTSHVGFTYWLPKAGFDLVTFDYQGYGASEGAPTRENTVGDGVLVIAEAVRRNGGKPVFVLGQSLGAAVGFTSVALSTPGTVCGMAFESGFGSYRQLARAKLGGIFLTWPLQVPLSYLVTDDLSPLRVAERFRVPILFLHGTEDRVVPLAEGKRLFAALPPRQGEWMELEGAGHTPSFGWEGSPFHATLTNFMERVCPRGQGLPGNVPARSN